MWLVVESWSLIQETAGSSPFAVITNIFCHWIQWIQSSFSHKDQITFQTLIYILTLNLHQASFYDTELISNNFSVKLKLDCKFKVYKARFYLKLM